MKTEFKILIRNFFSIIETCGILLIGNGKADNRLLPTMVNMLLNKIFLRYILKKKNVEKHKRKLFITQPSLFFFSITTLGVVFYIWRSELF